MVSRCWLETDRIVRYLSNIRRQHPTERLERVFVATNLPQEWSDLFRERMYAKGWRFVWTSNDLSLSWEESGVDNAIGELFASVPTNSSHGLTRGFRYGISLSCCGFRW